VVAEKNAVKQQSYCFRLALYAGATFSLNKWNFNSNAEKISLKKCLKKLGGGGACVLLQNSEARESGGI